MQVITVKNIYLKVPELMKLQTNNSINEEVKTTGV